VFSLYCVIVYSQSVFLFSIFSVMSLHCIPALNYIICINQRDEYMWFNVQTPHYYIYMLYFMRSVQISLMFSACIMLKELYCLLTTTAIHICRGYAKIVLAK